MVISIDTLLIKQLRKLLNVILQLVFSLDKTFEGNNSILENMSILTDIATTDFLKASIAHWFLHITSLHLSKFFTISSKNAHHASSQLVLSLCLHKTRYMN